MYPADLDSPRRELSNCGLGIVVALLVRWQINFSCASTGSAIQLYATAKKPTPTSTGIKHMGHNMALANHRQMHRAGHMRRNRTRRTSTTTYDRPRQTEH